MGTSKEKNVSAISGHKVSMPPHQALPLAAHQNTGYKKTFPIKQLLALKQLKVLAEEYSVSQGKVSREEVTQEGKNIRHSAPAQGAGLSWHTASRMCELQDRAIPFREMCCLQGPMEQSSFGMGRGMLHSPAPQHLTPQSTSPPGLQL